MISQFEIVEIKLFIMGGGKFLDLGLNFNGLPLCTDARGYRPPPPASASTPTPGWSRPPPSPTPTS